MLHVETTQIHETGFLVIILHWLLNYSTRTRRVWVDKWAYFCNFSFTMLQKAQLPVPIPKVQRNSVPLPPFHCKSHLSPGHCSQFADAMSSEPTLTASRQNGRPEIKEHCFPGNGKGKSVPLQAWSGPEGSRNLTFWRRNFF